MYEPTRAKTGHPTAEPEYPHRSREEELDIQLAGHLSALLTVTEELHALAAAGHVADSESAPELETAAARIAAEVARLHRQPRPPRSRVPADPPASDGARVTALHHEAHTLAGRALVVAASRADTAAAILAAERMDAHAAVVSGEPATAGRR